MLVYQKGDIDYYESSNILTSQYNKDKQELYITFLNGGVYKYDNISESTYENFKNADSQGKYFLKEIKTNKSIPYQKVAEYSKLEAQGVQSFIKSKKSELEN